MHRLLRFGAGWCARGVRRNSSGSGLVCAWWSTYLMTLASTSDAGDDRVTGLIGHLDLSGSHAGPGQSLDWTGELLLARSAGFSSVMVYLHSLSLVIISWRLVSQKTVSNGHFLWSNEVRWCCVIIQTPFGRVRYLGHCMRFSIDWYPCALQSILGVE